MQEKSQLEWAKASLVYFLKLARESPPKNS